MNKKPANPHNVVTTRWMKMPLTVFVVAIVLGLFGRKPALAYTGTASYSGLNGAYKYVVAYRDSKADEVQIVLDLGDTTAVELYRQASNQRSLELLASVQSQRLWATITFVKPLSINEALSLAKEAGVESASYTQVGWTASGERTGSTIFVSPDSDIEKLASQALVASSAEDPIFGARMAGFILVEGYITISEESLGKLLTDERVYLVDTTAHEVKNLLGEAAHQDTVFHLPSPFWGMDWGK